MFLLRWLKWARRDRQVAFILIIDAILAVVVIVGLLILFWPKPAPLTATSPTPAPPPGLVLPAVGYDAITPSPLPPTINPTQLAEIPNQGLSSAPTPPANLGTGGTVPPPTKK
jgi:hypothetical protein